VLNPNLILLVSCFKQVVFFCNCSLAVQVAKHNQQECCR